MISFAAQSGCQSIRRCAMSLVRLAHRSALFCAVVLLFGAASSAELPGAFAPPGDASPAAAPRDASASAPDLPAIQREFERIAAEVSPSVVGLRVRRTFAGMSSGASSEQVHAPSAVIVHGT